MIDKLKKQRRGYVVILVMVISLVTQLSPGMAMPTAMSKPTPVSVDAMSMDVMSMDVNSENHSSEESRASKTMQVSASGCHSASHASTSDLITPSSIQSTAKNDHTIHNVSSAPSKAMKSMDHSMHGVTPDSCCDVQCQCPAGACAAVYAVINNEVSVAVIAHAPLVLFVNHQAPHTIPNAQFRPPKFAFAG
ncbi:hypothetical protein J8L84_16630 [Alteromonas sp. MMG017]|uniref:hypothetical protein n=1 Tax=Alteromonas sp. MMG017 TaxID=2822692 RepID=UPI001B3A4A55|nr:hypothetical protein [Alteromonas sp. MMG017]MBQ4830904.1 hypothetical protein [Alteromonas sp. MMG017]